MESGDGFGERLRYHTRAFFTNWQEYDASFGTKVALTFTNRAKALRHGCCGNHGQPGC